MRQDIQFAKIDVKNESKAKKVVFAFFCILLMSILAFFTVLSVSAYFTASANKTGKISFGEIEISVDESGYSSASFSTEFLSNVMPGLTLTFDKIKITNSGDFNAYTLINLDVSIPSSNKTITSRNLHYNLWFNLDGEQVDVVNMAVNETKPNVLESGDSKTTFIKWQVPSDALTNAYKNSTMAVTITAFATQTILPEAKGYKDHALYASYFICSNASKIASETGATFKGIDATTEPLRRVVTGKNLFDETMYDELGEYINGETYSYAPIYLKPNKTFVVSVSRTEGFDATETNLLLSSKPRINYDWSAIAHMSTPDESHVNYVYTTDESGLLFIGYTKSTTTQTNLTNIWNNTNVQIEEGTTATAYEAFSSVEDSFNIDTQTLTRNVGKYEFTGEEEFSIMSYEFEYSLSKSAYVSNIDPTYATTAILASHNFEVTSSYQANEPFIFRAGTSYINFNYDNGLKGIDNFKLWLKEQYDAGNPVKMWYKFNTGETEKILTSKNLYQGSQRLVYETGGDCDLASHNFAMNITKGATAVYSNTIQLGGDVFDYVLDKKFTVSFKIKLYEDDDATNLRALVGLYSNETYLATAEINGDYRIVDEWTYVSFTVDAISSLNLTNFNKYCIWLTAESSYTKRHYVVKDIQFEVGESPTDFENHDSTVYKRVNTNVLRKFSTSKDIYDSGNKIILRNVLKLEITGYESVSNWNMFANSKTENTAGFYYKSSTDLGTYLNPVWHQGLIKCTHFTQITHTGVHTADDSLVWSLYSAPASEPPYLAFKVPYTNKEDCLKWFKNEKDNGTPVTVWLRLITSKTESIA